MKITYTPKRFGSATAAIIEHANAIIKEYVGQGYRLTLRQLYYQFVSRALIANKQSEYKRLGKIVNDARLAGLIDWEAIEDRGRNLNTLAHWDSPADIVRACAAQYREDLWADQPRRVEVWIEKEALLGVFAATCEKWRVPYFACKGYTSQSEMWNSGHKRLAIYRRVHGQQPLILHFGDHDPSGIDMTRDIAERLAMFMGGHLEVQRIALNMDQVEAYKPPPNPAKLTDPRAGRYLIEHGDQSWELDALEPATLNALVAERITAVIDTELWEAAETMEQTGRDKLARAVTWLESQENHT